MQKRELKRVAVLVEHRYGYFRDVLRGIRTYARQGHPWVVHTVDSASFAVERILASKLDGIVGHTGGPEHRRGVLSAGVPVVFVVRSAEACPAPVVVTDDRAVGGLAAEHLLGLGLRHFAFVGEAVFPHARLRGEGFAEALRRDAPNVRVHSFLGAAPPSREFGGDRAEAEFDAWLARLPRPLGLLAANDTWAAAVADRCHELGLKIPDEVALLGVDNDDLVCESANPALSSVQTAGLRIGYEAARLLDARMAGIAPVAPLIEIPPLQVVARESTSALPLASAAVVAAVRFIRAQSHQPLSVSDVAAAAHVSRRLLELHFRAELGRTVLGEIHRAQVDRARHLLIETDLPMGAVAEAAGFSSATRMGIVFLKHTGVAPSRYRSRVRIGAMR